MRPQSSIFLVAAWALLAAATPLDIASQKQYPMAIPSTSKDLKVPGHSPAYYCEDPSDDLFQISSFEFSPTRPRM